MARRRAGFPRSHSALRESLNRRRVVEADIRFARYVRPKGGGLHLVSDPSGANPRVVAAATGATTYRPGQQVALGSQSGDLFRGETILGTAPPQEQGAHRSAPGVFLPIEESFPVIISAAPASIAAGSAEAVTVTGMGFRSSPADVFSLVVYDEETGEDIADPWATITSVVVVNETTMTCTIGTDIDTPADHQLSIRVERAV